MAEANKAKAVLALVDQARETARALNMTLQDVITLLQEVTMDQTTTPSPGTDEDTTNSNDHGLADSRFNNNTRKQDATSSNGHGLGQLRFPAPKNKTLTSGKHKGSTFQWVSETDPDYLKWVLDNASACSEASLVLFTEWVRARYQVVKFKPSGSGMLVPLQGQQEILTGIYRGLDYAKIKEAARAKAPERNKAKNATVETLPRPPSRSSDSVLP